jgi:hypothetical protein
MGPTLQNEASELKYTVSADIWQEQRAAERSGKQLRTETRIARHSTETRDNRVASVPNENTERNRDETHWEITSS